MSISVMKQALDAITNVLAGGDFDNPYADLKEAGLALRQAIEQAEKQEPVSELLKLMAEDGVTGVLIEVHRGPLSKSIRTWGECDCPTSTDNDVTIEVQP